MQKNIADNKFIFETQGLPMKSKFFTYSVFAIIFFLVFLGMRNVYLLGGKDPKPRPRAVVESAAKKAGDVVLVSVDHSAEAIAFRVVPPCRACVSFPHREESPSLPPTLSKHLPARAPPVAAALRPATLSL